MKVKKYWLIILFFGLVSCTKVAKDYAILSGQIKNANKKELVIKNRTGYNKKILIKENGSFSDTLHLKNKGDLFLFSINETSPIFLKNNDEIKVSLDANNIIKTIKFTGKGSETSVYLIEKIALQNKFIKGLFDIDIERFKIKTIEIKKSFNNLLEKHKSIDSLFYSSEKEYIEKLPELLMSQYNQLQNQKNKFSNLEGKTIPNFEFDNYKGGKTSFNDLKGKYLYIDVWATWCQPCLKEIPHLLKLEKDFKNKNIEFVSISIDKESAKSTWKKMILDKKMGGIQLIVNNNDFKLNYKINSIPRFILLDPKGNVINANMNRPSNPKTFDFLNNLLK